jgi:site-specific DNA-methyltransferase (adenine-specific)
MPDPTAAAPPSPEVHPIPDLFPAMSAAEYAELKADIQAHGQREPIWTWQGKVIDGRHRARACAELGLEPRTRAWDGQGSLVAFVVSLNLQRRHLTSSQRAAVGLDVEKRLAEEAKGRQKAAGGDKRSPRAVETKVARGVAAETQGESVREKVPEAVKEAKRPRAVAAKLTGTNPRYVQDMKAVEKADPALVQKVKDGALTVAQAKREVQRQARRVALEARAREAEASPAGRQPGWEIIEGDCVAVMRSLPPKYARLIFADPPYNEGVDYGKGAKADRLPDDRYLGWCREWMAAAIDLLTDDGSLWVLISKDYAADFGVILHRELGLHLRAPITWYESFGVNCSRNFNRCSRVLYYMTRDPKQFVFNEDAVTRPSDRQTKYGDARADPGGKLWDDVWGINPPIPRLVGTAEERIPDFPTQLPLALLCPIVGCASEPGDLIVDPFSGSATTGAAALMAGRRYKGIDLSAKFVRLSRARLDGIGGDFHARTTR